MQNYTYDFCCLSLPSEKLSLLEGVTEEEFPFLKGNERTISDLLVLRTGEMPVALATARIDRDENTLFVDFIEVAHGKKHSGIGTSFLRNIFEYSQQNLSTSRGIASLVVDGFTDDGKKYLLPKISELQTEYKRVEVHFVQTC